MKHYLAFAFIFLLGPLSAAAAPSTALPITKIEISGTINPGSADYVRSALVRSKELNAQAMILVLNTPGGLLSSTREIVQYFSTSSVPVVVFVSPGGASATSAGAVISLSSHLSAMSPGTNIGAAHPVGSGGEDVKSDMGQKVVNDTAALVRAQAVLRGRNVELAEKIVTQSLSLSSNEAKDKNVVNFIAADLDSLLAQLDQKKIFVEAKKAEMTFSTAGLYAASIVDIPMTRTQQFLHFIANPNISALLITIGGMAFYIELASAFSFVAPGVIGLLMFALGAVSLSLLPINLGGILLLGLGLIFFVAEIFITSFGVLFVAGLISVCLGAMFLIDPNAADIKVSYMVLGPMVLGFVIVAAAIAWMLRKDAPMKTPLNEVLTNQTGNVESLNRDGRSGTLKVQGEIWSFISDEELHKNDQVIILERNNLSLKVKRRT